MSRSNPHVNAPNPAVRWFEWNGEKGVVRYYDKTEKKQIDVPFGFTFLLLDQLASVRGWHDASASAIYSNEVKDTRQSALIVKAFKGGTLAEGIYRDIKDRVHTVGGQFVANCYIAFKQGEELQIGSLRFKGAALGAWMDFGKAHRGDLYSQAIAITSAESGKKGRIVYQMPVFETRKIAADTQHQAVALDRQLQDWLASYLARNTKDQVEHVPDEGAEPPASGNEPLTDDDIPFAWALPLLLPMAGLFGAFTV
jgi:hypothetical protein